MEDFIGEFVWEKDDEIEAALEALGAPENYRRLVSATHGTKKLTDNGDGSYTMEEKLGIKKVSHSFKLGETFRHPLYDIHQQVTIMLDGKKLIETHKLPSLHIDFQVYFIRDGDYLILMMDTPKCAGKRYMKKQ